LQGDVAGFAAVARDASRSVKRRRRASSAGAGDSHKGAVRILLRLLSKSCLRDNRHLLEDAVAIVFANGLQDAVAYRRHASGNRRRMQIDRTMAAGIVNVPPLIFVPAGAVVSVST